jgi:Tol biopolymer transport system component
MGEVYRARDPRIGREVAVKVLPQEFVADPERLQRFEREVRAIGALNHPNLLALYDVGASDIGPYLVSELLEGESLRARLLRGPVALREVLDWGTQISHGLAAAHERGVVHRDLKPENVFVLRDGRVKILDFGLAKIDGAAVSPQADTATAPVATGAGVALGTVGYMAPEQVRGDLVGPPADIFALGVVLYELVTGRAAFQRPTAIETLHAILTETPARMASVPAAVERVIARCLEKEPMNRFQTPADVAFALDAVLARPSRRLSQRHVAVLGAVALLTLAGLGAWVVYTGRGEPTPASSPAAPRMTPFLSTDAIEKQPVWSPTGDLIAYVSDAAGNDDIWIADPSGGNPINLTHTFTGADSWPAWSSDGRAIAFYSVREGGGIYTMTALGAQVRRVVPLKAGVLYTFSLTWARDGSLVYTGFDAAGIKRIFRVAATGGEPACLTCAWADAPAARAGELSPSAEYLVFLSTEVGPRADLYIAHLASGRIRKVTNQADWPHWSRDGRQIFFISSRDGQPDLWQFTVNLADGSALGEPRKLTSALGATTFAVSPDGTQILAVKEQSTSHLWSYSRSDTTSDPSAGTQLTSGNVRDDRGRWSSDGRGIFFQSSRRGSLDIWRMSEVGTTPVRLTAGEGSEHRPRPSPQGDWIAVDVVNEKGEFTHLMRPDGSQLHPLNDGWFGTYTHVCCADWSPDGSRLAVELSTREDGPSGTLAIASIDRTAGRATATRVLRTLPGGAPEYGRWSPDGRLIAYEALTEGSWDLWLIEPDALRPIRLTDYGGNDRQAVWQRDQRQLYFIRDSSEVWRIPFSADGAPAGPAVPWFVPQGRLRVAADSLDISPSGDRMLMTLLADASDIWLIELR